MPRKGRGFSFQPQVSRTRPGSIVVQIGQAVESDSTLGPITVTKVVVLGQAQETDSTQPIIGNKTLAIGFPTESDLAQPITVIRNRVVDIGQAIETDTALGPMGKGKSIGQPAETDEAHSITPQKIVQIGQAEENDSAQNISFSGAKVIPLGQAQETDEAQSVKWQQVRLINTAEEINTAGELHRGTIVELGQAIEDELAYPINLVKSVVIGQAEETDEAQSIDRAAITVLLGQAVETDEAQPIFFPKVRLLGQASESDSAGGINAKFLLPTPRQITVVNKSVWKFELVRSKDMYRIDELKQARSRVLTIGLNKAGSLSFNVPLEDELTDQIQEGTTGVVVRRNGIAVWSGIVWTVNEQTPNTVSIGCVGWLQTLEKRVSKLKWGNPLIYSNTDAGKIALNLLTRSNSDTPAGSYNYIFPGQVVDLTQARDRSYAPFISILSEINALSDIESGFDMITDPENRYLDIYSKIQMDRQNLRFEYGVNVNNVTRNSDMSRVCNRMTAYSSIGAAQVDDLESQQIYGVYEEAASLSDVSDIGILQAYAAAEVAVRSKPLRVATFIPKPFSSLNPDDPRIFEDFNIGDIGYFSVDKGRLKVHKQAARVFGAAIGFQDNGDESITSLQTTAS